MSHVRTMAGGRFEARYRTADGRERSKRFGTRREARAFLDQVGIDQRLGDWRDPSGGASRSVRVGSGVAGDERRTATVVCCP